MQPIVSIALRAAQSAADKINYTLLNMANLTAEGATREEVLNKAIEDAAWRARKTIRNAHTKHHIDSVQLGLEESRDWDRQSKWVIDVASGETNLRAGFPGFLINIALYTKDKIDVVAIVDPMTGDHITAQRGRALQMNERRIRAEVVPFNQAIIAIDTPDFDVVAHWRQRTPLIRMTGCPLYNFVLLASGKANIAIAQNMSPSDMASAMLIATESGALTGNAKGGPVAIAKGELLAAAPKLYKQAVSALV